VTPVLDLPELLRDPSKIEFGIDSGTDASQDAFKKPSVLVVDDSLSARRSISQFMQDSGYDIRTARDGVEAVEILKVFTPNILLVDMEMPRMNGIELTAYVRSQKSIAKLPIIMITSRSTSKHQQQAEQAGVNSYFTKPFTDEELFGEIEKLRA
ncbi:MAG: response regulator, partial [Gammaproteobacteria bacterium]